MPFHERLFLFFEFALGTALFLIMLAIFVVAAYVHRKYLPVVGVMFCALIVFGLTW